MKPPRVVLADDHTLFLEALRKLLESECHVVDMVTDGRALVRSVLQFRPEVVVVDINMPQLNGLDAARHLQAQVPETKLIFLTVNEDPDVAAEAVRRGAMGYLLKKSAATELFTAIRQVLNGRHYITPLIAHDSTRRFVSQAELAPQKPQLTLRQREVLQLLAEGRSMKEAAVILNVTPRTIAFHKYSMMQQHGFHSSAELVQFAVRLGLVSPPDAPDRTC